MRRNTNENKNKNEHENKNENDNKNACVCVSLRLSLLKSLLIEYQENLFDNINIRNVITKDFSYLILSYKIINFQFYFRINVLDCTIT